MMTESQTPLATLWSASAVRVELQVRGSIRDGQVLDPVELAQAFADAHGLARMLSAALAKEFPIAHQVLQRAEALLHAIYAAGPALAVRQDRLVREARDVVCVESTVAPALAAAEALENMLATAYRRVAERPRPSSGLLSSTSRAAS